MAASGQSLFSHARDLKSDLHIYKFGSKANYLGQGSFGKVLLARREDGLLVAIKIAHANDPAHLYMHETGLRRELRLQKKLKHPNICQVLDAFDSSDGLNNLIHPEQHVVLEYCNAGDLHNVVDRGLPMTWVYQTLAPALFCALEYLDRVHHCVHNDIKPDNILFEERAIEVNASSAKLADFGLAAPVNAAGRRERTAYQYQIWEPDWVYRNGRIYSTPAVDVFRAVIVIAWTLNVTLPSLNGEGFRSVQQFAPLEWCVERRREIHRDIFNSPEMKPFRLAWARPTSAEWNADQVSECRARKIQAKLLSSGRALPDMGALRIQTGKEVCDQFRSKIERLQEYRQQVVQEVADAFERAKALREESQKLDSGVRRGSSRMAAQLRSKVKSAYEAAEALKAKYEIELANLEEAKTKTDETERQAEARAYAAARVESAEQRMEAHKDIEATTRNAANDPKVATSALAK